MVARRAAHAGARRSAALGRRRAAPSAGRRPSRQLVAREASARWWARESGGALRATAAAQRPAARAALTTALVDALRCGLWPSAPLLTYAAHGARARLLEPAALVDGVGVQLREALGQLAAGNGAATAARRCEALLTLAADVLPCALIDSDGDSDGDGDAQPAGGGDRSRLLPRRRPSRARSRRWRVGHGAPPSSSPPPSPRAADALLSVATSSGAGAHALCVAARWCRASGICSATPSATPRRAVTRRARCVRCLGCCPAMAAAAAPCAPRALLARALLRRSLLPMHPWLDSGAPPLELLTGGAVWRALEASRAPPAAPAATAAAAPEA